MVQLLYQWYSYNNYNSDQSLRIFSLSEVRRKDVAISSESLSHQIATSLLTPPARQAFLAMTGYFESL